MAGQAGHMCSRLAGHKFGHLECDMCGPLAGYICSSGFHMCSWQVRHMSTRPTGHMFGRLAGHVSDRMSGHMSSRLSSHTFCRLSAFMSGLWDGHMLGRLAA